MDAIYQLIESFHVFIPIIAVSVVCVTLYFCRAGRPDDEEEVVVEEYMLEPEGVLTFDDDDENCNNEREDARKKDA